MFLTYLILGTRYREEPGIVHLITERNIVDQRIPAEKIS